MGNPFDNIMGSIIELQCGGGFNTWGGGLVIDGELTSGGGGGFS
jgi:hypothetical protein